MKVLLPCSVAVLVAGQSAKANFVDQSASYLSNLLSPFEALQDSFAPPAYEDSRPANNHINDPAYSAYLRERKSALNLAGNLLNSHAVSEAIDEFDKIIKLDHQSTYPLDNADKASVFYQRAIAYLALKRLDKAKVDLQTVLELHPIENAKTKLSKVYLRLGDVESALSVLPKASASSSKQSSLESQIDTARSNLLNARSYCSRRHWNECLNSIENVIDICSESVEASELRVTALFGLGRINDALAEVSRSISLAPSSIPVLTRSSMLSLLYASNPADRARARSYLRSCTRLQDPEEKGGCRTMSKESKKILAQLDMLVDKVRNEQDNDGSIQEWKNLAGQADQVSKLAKQFLVSQYKSSQILQHIFVSEDEAISKSGLIWNALDMGCKCERKIKGPEKKRNLTKMCESSVKMHVDRPSQTEYNDDQDDQDENDQEKILGMCVEGCLARGESYLAKGNLSKAKNMFIKVLQSSMDSNEEAKHLLNQVNEQERQERIKQQQQQRKQQQSHYQKQQAFRAKRNPNRPDYYKVLDIDKNADYRSIKRAYRKRTLTAHPDKGGSEEEMTRVNEAFEVLGDEEKRKIYDAGGDPLNQQEGFGGGSDHPFFQGGSRFPFTFYTSSNGGGSNQHFKAAFDNMFFGSFTPGGEGAGQRKRGF